MMETKCHLQIVLCLLGLTMILMPVHVTTLPIGYLCSESGPPSEDPDVDLTFSLACSPGHVDVTVNKHSITLDTIFVNVLCDCIYTDGHNNTKVESLRQEGVFGNINSFDTRIATTEEHISLSGTVKAAAGYNCTIRALSKALLDDCFRYFDGPTEPWCLQGEPTNTTTTADYPSSQSSMSSIPSGNPNGPSPTISASLPTTVINLRDTISTSSDPSSLSSMILSRYIPSGNSSILLTTISASLPTTATLNHSTTTTTATIITSSFSDVSLTSCTYKQAAITTSYTSSSLVLSSQNSQSSLKVYFIMISTGLAVAIALIIFLLCFIIFKRHERNNSISANEFNQADTLFVSNRDLNITIKNHSNTIRSPTGSVETVVQSLEIHIHSTDGMNKDESPFNNSNDNLQRNEIIIETNMNDGVSEEVHRTPSDNDKTTASHMMEAENEIQESTSFHRSPSLSSINPVAADFNDRISCTSVDSCEYVETTATELSSSQFIGSLRASTDTSSPLYCPRLQIQPVPPLDDISIQSSQFSDDGNEQSASSEGYATEHTSDYIEHLYDTETDNSGGLYPPSTTTAISMCNAQVNDYVFQKKINNKFVLQSSPSSSGYYSSGYTANSTTA